MYLHVLTIDTYIERTDICFNHSKDPFPSEQHLSEPHPAPVPELILQWICSF